MISKKIRQQLETYLPGYVKGDLKPLQRKLVQLWLKRDEQARIQADNLQQLQSAGRRQPHLNPPPAVLHQIQSRIHTLPHNQPVLHPPVRAAVRLSFSTPVLLLSLVAFVLTLSLVWQTLPPGIVLQWSVEGEAAQGFHVYRATVEPGRTAEPSSFILLDEVPARSNQAAYTFTDVRLLPGQEYVYRVDVLDQQGQPAASQTVFGRSADALPGQIAMLMVVLFASYSLWAIHKWWQSFRTGFGLLQ
jgi:hypothetical protein